MAKYFEKISKVFSKQEETEDVMTRFRNLNKKIEYKQMKYKQAKSTDELCLAIFTGVLSGMALGHLCGSLEPEFNPELTESHSLEIGLSVGAAVCAIPIAYHFLKRYALKQQIKSLEKQRDIVSKESSYTKNRNTGLTK